MSDAALLLDTNAVIALMRSDAALARVVDRADSVAISVVVLGELLFGARCSARPGENLEALRRHVGGLTVHPVESAVAERYAAVRQGLRRAGRPIPHNDAWIAATAMHHSLSLVTRDVHFRSVEGLRLLTW